jgi:transposase
MGGKRYHEEFKIGAVRQVTERGHPDTEQAPRPGASSHSLYQWVGRYCAPPAGRQRADDRQAQMKRLKAGRKRVTEERAILKRPPRSLPMSGKVGLHSRCPQ